MTVPTGRTYQQGTAVTLDALFETGNTPADPTTVTFRLRQPDDTLVSYVYGTDLQVSRLDTGSFECELGIPPMAGQYHYDAVGTGAVEATLPGDFYVVASSVVPPSPLPGEPPQAGPCSTWINGDDISALCGVDYDSSSGYRLDQAAIAASQLLFEMSGRQFTGICTQTVRPCLQPCSAWSLAGYPSQWYGFGFNGGLDSWGWWGGDGASLCGCRPLSQVKLPGYPVVEITAVTIDGAVLPALDGDGQPNYRLDQWQLLTRMGDVSGRPRFWPGCQNLDLADSQPGTFTVEYVFGTPPPLPGVLAAQELGCELYKALVGDECRLPVGASQVVRQGVTINRGLLVSWALAQSARGGAHPRSWSTGLPLTDAFLSAYNPYGRRSRARIWSPDLQQFARQAGTP